MAEIAERSFSLHDSQKGGRKGERGRQRGSGWRGRERECVEWEGGRKGDSQGGEKGREGKGEKNGEGGRTSRAELNDFLLQ